MANCQHSGCRMNPGSHDYCPHHRPDDEFPECSICLKAIRRTKDTLDCSHSFHRRCIDKWFERSNACPICRAPIVEEQPQNDDWIQNLHTLMAEQLGHAVADLNAGATNVEIRMIFNVPGGGRENS